ncbi:hypothetical protein Moror_7693 [Moniliophthora roreri MCA 2997]|uniref:N-acetyltransferase domain-containing protein n=1 Tax=Moniliophthora roreri (strain MCA 2997) TaxID=1381753 RepID=V2YEY1_MONRO|nr:hypothetical protein Moror_7693 [Moniliophthora roreri MCA 2997]
MDQIDVRIRIYRPEDFEDVRRIFYDGMAYGPHSVVHYARISNYKRPLSILAYTLLAPAIWLVTQEHYMQSFSGVMLIGCVAVYLTWIFRATEKCMVGYCEQSMGDDLFDIVEYYGLVVAENGKDHMPSGKSCFWVAEIERRVVGCIALDVSTDPNIGELRRMSVSNLYTRRGIGSKLIRTLIDFAEDQKLVSIQLTTSRFQPDAIRVYLKHGLKVNAVNADILTIGLTPVHFVTMNLLL